MPPGCPRDGVQESVELIQAREYLFFRRLRVIAFEHQWDFSGVELD